MDEDGDLPPEDDPKPVINTIESSLPSYGFPEEAKRGGGSVVVVVGAGGVGDTVRGNRNKSSSSSSSSSGLVVGRKDERMAGGDVDEDIYEDEEEHELVMDEGDNEDNDDNNVDDEDDVDEHTMSQEEEEQVVDTVIEDGIVGDNVHGDGDGDDDVDDEDEEEGEDEEDGGDTTDGAPPQLESTIVKEQVLKRPHIQSKRMQEYQEMQQMTHTPGRVFTCPDANCRRVFNSAPGLRYHVRQTHQGSMESFICESCRKKFKSLNGLKYHIKRRRCQGFIAGANSTTSPSSSQEVSSVPPPADGPSRVPPPPLVLPPRDECPAPRLLDLANIATGPQSPLLQGLGSSRVGTSFFDSPEKNAVMALSSMAQKRSSRNSTAEEPEESNVKGPGPGPGVEHDPAAIKSKRPMNGFMLFAQKNRAEFNKMYPHTNNRMISTKLSEKWTKLPEVERQKWKEDARQMAEVQRSKHPDCWKRKKYSKDRN